MNIAIAKQRTHVTLAYSGEKFLKLPKIGKTQITLVHGDNLVPIGYFHALGCSQEFADLIISGVITPVCREHDFRPDEDACRNCGHNRESAEAETLATKKAHDDEEMRRGPAGRESPGAGKASRGNQGQR